MLICFKHPKGMTSGSMEAKGERKARWHQLLGRFLCILIGFDEVIFGSLGCGLRFLGEETTRLSDSEAHGG
jgi:hypothetical protein